MNLFSVKGQEWNRESNVMSEAYWKLWNHEVQAKIDIDIEKYRKADVLIRLIVD